MKLYSRGQVLFFSILSALVVVLLAFGFGLFKPKNSKVEVSRQAEQGEVNANKLHENKLNEYNLMQTDYSVFNTSDLTGFSESERENITIYDRLNSAVVNITTETMAINWFLEPVPQEGSSGSVELSISAAMF